MHRGHLISRSSFAQACCAVALAWPACAAAADSGHDIHYLAEHVPESGMDAHYQSLPWPAGPLTRGQWQTSLDVSHASTRTEFIDFDSEMQISGGGGRAVLGAGFLPGVPLHVPELAEYPAARGTLRQFGIGAAAVREGRARSPSSAQVIVGVLLEQVDVSGFELDYRLLAGPDAGVTGILDHSSRAAFLTPFVGWQQTRPLSRRWDWSPRALFAMPVPAGDFDARLLGPGVDVSTRAGGSPLKIGDGFATFGLALTHRPSGLEIDLEARRPM